MTNKNRALGNGLESRVVARSLRRGLRAHRQPGSGVFREYPNDVVVERLLGECKVRSDLPSLAKMFEWMENAQANAKRKRFVGSFLVFNRKGSRKPVVMMDLDLLLDILASVRPDSEFLQEGDSLLDNSQIV